MPEVRSAKHDHGSTMILALVAIASLTALVGVGIHRARVDNRLAGSWQRNIRAFEAADAGLNIVARKVLGYYVENSRSLNGVFGRIYPESAGGGDVAVLVLNNSDLDGTNQDCPASDTCLPDEDNDKIFQLLSSGQVGESEQVIEAFYRVKEALSPNPKDLEGMGAVGFCFADTETTAQIEIRGNAKIDGNNYFLPPYACTGNGCDAAVDPDGDPVAGVSHPSSTTLTYTQNPPIGSPPDRTADLDCAGWDSYMADAAAAAQHQVNGGTFQQPDPLFGSLEKPKIVTVDGDVALRGNFFGAGILIVRGNLTLSGTAVWAGMIFVQSASGSVTFAAGTPRVYGSILLSNMVDQLGTELRVRGTTDLRYSTAGLQIAEQAFEDATGDTSLELLAWRTTDLPYLQSR